ncbi:MAG: DUF1439 domain-containing protein [Gammaproteobacteria bacterium]|nr:DUF1439 domain-containing protein [Gammaproteobacteria bacterium]
MIRKLIFTFVLLAFSNCALALSFSYTLELSEKEVQTKIEAKMPFEKKKFFVSVVVSNPKIKLTNGDNKIGINADILVKLPGGIESTGKIFIEGGINYKPKTGEFFFVDPEVKKIEFDKLPEKYNPNVVKVVDVSVKKVLAKTPVYKFKDDDLKHKLAKSTLKSVNIKNGILALELGI